MKKLLLMLLGGCAFAAAHAQVSTPGTGVNWNFDSLVAHYPAVITQTTPLNYTVNNVITISPTDTLEEHRVVTVSFDSAATISFKKCTAILQGGGLGSITFKASDTTKRFVRLRLDSVQTGRFAFLNVSYSKGMSLIYSRATFDNCIFSRVKGATSDPSGAVSLLGSYALISSCYFYDNSRSAINIGANGGSGLKVFDSYFLRNNTENGNYPQINIGTASDSGIVIKGCTINGLYPRGGAIGFLNVFAGNYKIDVSNNIIRGNRYGIAVNGRGVSGVIANNIIDSNCIENNPALGGSGLNFLGDSSINIIVTGNTIRKNLWGVTMQQSAAGAGKAPRVSFGRIAPILPVDTGRNVFDSNGNNNKIYAIYNNTVDTVWAQNNTWDDTSVAGIENTVFHRVDSAALGLVIFNPRYIAPVPPVTGVGTVPGNEEVQVWPNPVRNGDAILINSRQQISSYTLISVNGQVALRSEVRDAKCPPIQISGLAPGMYYLLIKGHNWQKINPVVVQ